MNQPEKMVVTYESTMTEYFVLASTKAIRINHCIPLAGVDRCRDCHRLLCDKSDKVWVVDTATGSRGGLEGSTWHHVLQHETYECAVRHLSRIHGKPIDLAC